MFIIGGASFVVIWMWYLTAYFQWLTPEKVIKYTLDPPTRPAEKKILETPSIKVRVGGTALWKWVTMNSC
jgi:hypothetical protein